MANFKKQVTNQQNMFKPTVNHEGTTVHQMTDLETLFSQVLGSFFGESTHYEKKNVVTEFKYLYERIQRIPESDKEYILKIAELGRLCNMIDYPLDILSVVFNDNRFLGKNFIDSTGKNRIYDYADNIIQRAKDIVTIMTTQMVMFDKRSSDYIDIVGKRNEALPMQLRKTLKRKFESYDKFKLSKGLSNNSDVTLKDCMRLLRPKPKNKDFEKFFKELREGNVKVGDGKATINTESVKKGQTKTGDNSGLIKAVEDDILQNIVKNIVSLYKKDVFEDKKTLEIVCKRLRDPKEVKQSRLLPFRFYSAYNELEKFPTRVTVNSLKEALSDALDLSVSNVTTLEGVNCILLDRSGSMEERISDKSVVQALDMSAVLGAIAYKCGVGDLYVFSNSCKKVDISNKAPVMDIVKAIKRDMRVEGTQLKIALDTIANTGTRYDSLILLSDNDCYGYDKKTNVLTFGERTYRNEPMRNTPENHINTLISRGVFKKIILNNLLGNDFAVFNTASNTKILATGFSERFLEVINIQNMMGKDKDIKKVIDLLLQKFKGNTTTPPKSNIDPKDFVLI